MVSLGTGEAGEPELEHRLEDALLPLQTPMVGTDLSSFPKPCLSSCRVGPSELLLPQ